MVHWHHQVSSVSSIILVVVVVIILISKVETGFLSIIAITMIIDHCHHDHHHDCHHRRRHHRHQQQLISQRPIKKTHFGQDQQDKAEVPVALVNLVQGTVNT